MKKRVILSLAAAGLVAQSGCSSITLLRIEELKQVEAHVDSLKVELVALQEQIILEQKQQGEMLRMLRADQLVRFSEFERALKALSGNISESQTRLTEIDQKTLEIKKRWEEKAKDDSVARVSQSVEVENLFAIAHADFSAGRYDVAINGFKELMARHPDTRQAEEACYWMGESHYAQKKNDEAITWYKRYLKEYPTGARKCVTLYKLGMTYNAVGQQKARTMVWENLIKQCSDSEEAKAAKAQMK